MTQAVEGFHHLGLVSMAIILLSLGFMLRKGGADIKQSLSGHAAIQRWSYALFAGGLLLGGALFYAFATKWLAPTLQLNGWFSAVLAFALICELVTAVVPDSGGRKSFIHRTFAWSMAVGMQIFVLLLWLAPAISSGAKIVVTALLVYMLVDWCLFLFVKASHRHFLVFQGTYILSFYLATLAATYIR